MIVNSRFKQFFKKLRPKWKSDTNLEDKDKVYSYQVNATNEKTPHAMSRSSEWIDIPLQVPDGNDNIKPTTNNAFRSENVPPIPPPRKQKRKILESMKSAFKTAASSPKPVEEELCIQKKINYDCPCGRTGRHSHDERKTNNVGKETTPKKKKTPSVASLPNYTDFKLSIAGETTNVDASDRQHHSSAQSLPDESKKHSTKSSMDKLDNYLTRARSFGSLLPTMLLHKLQTSKAPLAEIESDDSLVGLDDWGGLKMIENYTPKDSSLPRPRKRTDAEILNEIEGMIELDVEETPQPPARKTESLIKRINDTCKTTSERAKSVTPPPTPNLSEQTRGDYITTAPKFEAMPLHDDDGRVEHSNLLHILEEFGGHNAAYKEPINDFLNAERAHFVSERSSTVAS